MQQIEFIRTVPAIGRSEKLFALAGASVQDIADGYLGGGVALEAFVRNPDGSATPIPAKMWGAVKPRQNGVVEFYARMHGGGGRTALALVAAIALSAIAGPAGTAIAGALFAGASTAFLGAAAAFITAGIVVGGGLLLSKLFAEEPQALSLSDQSQRRGDPADVSTDSNVLGKGAVLPHVWGGYRKVLLPDLIQPHSYIDNGVEAVEKMVGAWRGHAHRNIRVSDIPVDDHETITYEVKSGRDNAGIVTMIDRFTRTASVNVQTTQFRGDEAGLAENQVSPAQSDPLWHHFTTPDITPLDEFVIRLNFASMVKSDAPTTPITVPFRMQARVVGTEDWVNFPEIHVSAVDSGQQIKDIRIRRTDDFGAFDNDGVFSWTFWREVPAVTAYDLSDGSTGTQWEANAHFSSGVGLQAVQNISVRRHGLRIVLPTSVLPKGKIEWRIKRGISFTTSSLSSTYTIGGVVHSLYRSADVSGSWKMPVAQGSYPAELSVAIATVIADQLPVAQPNTFLIALRSRGQGFRGLSVELAGDAPDWNGSAWAIDSQSDNPATQCRYLCELAEQHFRTGKHSRFARIAALDESLVDEDFFVDWRAQCVKSSARAALVTNGMTLAEAMQRLMSAGFAQPAYGHKISGFFFRDTSAEPLAATFSPRNGTSISARYETPPIAAAVRATFGDAADDWEETEITVPALTPTTERRQETVQFEAIDSATQAQQRVEFDMLRKWHWRTTWTVQTEIEGLGVVPGEVVGLVTDLISDRAHGTRILSVTNSTTIVVDQTMSATETSETLSDVVDDWEDFFETGEQSYIAVYSASGMDIRQITSVTPGDGGMTLVLDSALTSTDVVGAHAAIGSLQEQVRRMLVVDVSPSGELGTVLTLADEKPEIYQHFKDKWGWTS